MKYKGYIIEEPYYIGHFYYQHEDFDGAEDSGDRRKGTGNSVEDCQEQIDEMLLAESEQHLYNFSQIYTTTN